MELILFRRYRKTKYTIGELYINGKFFCNTMEDKDRGLTQTMSDTLIKAIKIPNETAIPSGVYEVSLNYVSPKYSNFTKYQWSKAINGFVPRILDVKGYDGVLIHPGNTEADTAGCILVGLNKEPGKVINSTVTFMALYKKLKAAVAKGEKIKLTIHR